MNSSKLLSVCDQFNLASTPVKVENFGEGHIHETYLVETASHNPDYILQKINHVIFRDIPGMMGNIEAVTRHFKDKLLQLPGHNHDRESLSIVYSRSAKSFYEDEEGNFWRMFVFIPDTVTFQKINNPTIGFEAGKAIGFFQAMLADLKAPLVETIPDFHNINYRIEQYVKAKSADPLNRVREVNDDLDFAEQRFDRMIQYYLDLKEKASVRATHNDTKLNNILFDKNNKALCLIDLDTVMPGSVHFDYGDALRTMANTALEDEKDLSKVLFNKEVYYSFTDGYLLAADSFLNLEERELLPYAPIYLTFMIGLRFLTDYLNGDIYFRIHHPGHNLERARVQFRLVAEMEKFFGLNP